MGIREALAGEVTAVRTLLLNIPGTYTDRVSRSYELHGTSGVAAALKEMSYDLLRTLADPKRVIPGEHPEPTA